MTKNEEDIVYHQIFQEYTNSNGFTFLYNNFIYFLIDKKENLVIKIIEVISTYNQLQGKLKQKAEKNNRIQSTIDNLLNAFLKKEKLDKQIRKYNRCQKENLVEYQNKPTQKYVLPHNFYKSKIMLSDKEELSTLIANPQLIEIIQAIFQETNLAFINNQDYEAQVKLASDLNNLVDKQTEIWIKEHLEQLLSIVSDGVLPLSVQKMKQIYFEQNQSYNQQQQDEVKKKQVYAISLGLITQIIKQLQNIFKRVQFKFQSIQNLSYNYIIRLSKQNLLLQNRYKSTANSSSQIYQTNEEYQFQEKEEKKQQKQFYERYNLDKHQPKESNLIFANININKIKLLFRNEFFNEKKDEFTLFKKYLDKHTKKLENNNKKRDRNYQNLALQLEDNNSQNQL